MKRLDLAFTRHSKSMANALTFHMVRSKVFALSFLATPLFLLPKPLYRCTQPISCDELRLCRQFGWVRLLHTFVPSDAACELYTKVFVMLATFSEPNDIPVNRSFRTLYQSHQTCVACTPQFSRCTPWGLHWAPLTEGEHQMVDLGYVGLCPVAPFYCHAEEYDY